MAQAMTDDVKFAPCECTAAAEHWETTESPVDGDDDLGFYQCDTCGEMFCIDGTPEVSA